MRVVSAVFQEHGQRYIDLNLKIKNILDIIEKRIANDLNEHEKWLTNDYFMTLNLDENSLKLIQKIDNYYVLINENNKSNNSKIYFYKFEDGPQNVIRLIDDILKIQHNEIFPEENISKNKIYSIII